MATRRLILLPLRRYSQTKWIIGFAANQSTQASRHLRATTSAFFSTSFPDPKRGDLSISEYVGRTTSHLPPVLPTPDECCPSSAQRTTNNRAAASSSSAAASGTVSSGTPPPKRKNFLDKLWDRYSFTGHRHRVEIAESMFQAATRQASDP